MTNAQMIHTLLTPIAVALYGAAVVTLLAGLRGRVAVGRSGPIAFGLALPALAVQGVVLWPSLWTSAGINLALFNAAALLGWLMAAMLVLAAIRQPVYSLGLVVFPFAGITLVLAETLGVPGARPVAVGQPVDLHVISSVAAYAVLGLATAQALLLAWQESALRHRRAGAVLGLLPPLQSMEALLFQLLGSGFVLLSVALVSGWLFVDNLFAQDLVHKTVLSMLAWLVFAGLLTGRYQAGWRGRTAIRWTLAGVALLVLAYFGSKAVLELILNRPA